MKHLACQSFLHFYVELPSCVDRTETLSATKSKYHFLPQEWLSGELRVGCLWQNVVSGHRHIQQGWTELCVRQVGSDSAWPRVHVSKSSHAVPSLSSKTKPLAPVGAGQAQHEHRQHPSWLHSFLLSWAASSRNEELSFKHPCYGHPCRTSAGPVCFKTGDLEGFDSLFHFR